jgi:hypothetical protein
MFEDWKQAWRQAVDNFQREIRDAEAGSPPRVRAMEREIASASGALVKLEAEIRQARREAAQEREAEAVCRRREGLARNAGDDETVRVAADFAVRHGERASLFERKVVVLEEERALLTRDVATMRATLREAAPAAGAVGGAPSAGDVGDAPPSAERPPRPDLDERAFSRLENEARDRAADEKLEELKRRMRG